MYPPLARGVEEAEGVAVVSPPELPSSFSSCFTSAIESARATLSARAMESCFDLGGPACPSAIADSKTPSAQRMKCPFIFENPFFVGF
jgi:hypothetical protein